MDPNTSDSAEEREDDMSSLPAGFFAQMRKQAASTQGETTPGFEESGRKRLKWSSLDEEAQRSQQ